MCCFYFFIQAEDGIRDLTVTGVQTCALPISGFCRRHQAARRHDPLETGRRCPEIPRAGRNAGRDRRARARSEEHTSELQSQSNLVCRLLLEKKKNSVRLDRESSPPNCYM